MAGAVIRSWVVIALVANALTKVGLMNCDARVAGRRPDLRVSRGQIELLVTQSQSMSLPRNDSKQED